MRPWDTGGIEQGQNFLRHLLLWRVENYDRRAIAFCGRMNSATSSDEKWKSIRLVSHDRIPYEFMYLMGEYHKLLRLKPAGTADCVGMAVWEIVNKEKILSIPAKDLKKWMVQLSKEIDQNIVEKVQRLWLDLELKKKDAYIEKLKAIIIKLTWMKIQFKATPEYYIRQKR